MISTSSFASFVSPASKGLANVAPALLRGGLESDINSAVSSRVQDCGPALNSSRNDAGLLGMGEVPRGSHREADEADGLLVSGDEVDGSPKVGAGEEGQATDAVD